MGVLALKEGSYDRENGFGYDSDFRGNLDGGFRFRKSSPYFQIRFNG